MRRGLGIGGLLGVAACGTLIGHALTYVLEGRTAADGRHGYFLPVLEIAGASLVLCAVIFIVRATMTQPGRRALGVPSLPFIWAIVAPLQVAGFVALESIEGNSPDAVGWGVEVLVALIVAIAVSLFLGFVERCVIALAATYLSRVRNDRPLCATVLAVSPSLQLAVSTGVHRFKRPPPIVIG